MEDSNEVLKAMTEQSDHIFFIYNPHRERFTYVNAAFEEITKKDSSGLYENPLFLLEMIHPEDRGYVKEHFDTLASRETSSLIDFRIIRQDNVERSLRLNVYPILKGGKVQYITGIAEDDSARKASITNMQKVNGWKDSILEIIAHDLRGPIGIISILTAAITKHLPEEEYQQSREWLKMIDKISNRNLDLVRNLLTKESLDSAGVEISKERFDLVWEVNEVMQIFIKAHEDLNTKFELTYSHEHIYGQIDSMKYVQIINNLVSNAIKFTHDDGVIKVHLEKLDRSAVLSVQDNGIGIPPSLQPILFNKRTAAGHTGVNGEESVGLGMWIVKSLTEAHGGRVWFESGVRKGSTFYVEVPLGD